MIGELLLSILIITVATIVEIDIAKYPDLSKLLKVQPGVFPHVIAVFLYACAAIILLKLLYMLLIKKTDKDGVPFIEIEKKRAADTIKNLKENYPSLIGTVGTIVLMFLYAACLKKIGFEICTVLFILLVQLCCGERKPLRLVLVPLVTTVLVILIFRVMLKIALPLRIFTYI